MERIKVSDRNAILVNKTNRKEVLLSSYGGTSIIDGERTSEVQMVINPQEAGELRDGLHRVLDA